jgi:hypothetical protein
MQHEIKNTEELGEDLPFSGPPSSLVDLMVLLLDRSVKQGRHASSISGRIFMTDGVSAHIFETRNYPCFCPFRNNNGNSCL